MTCLGWKGGIGTSSRVVDVHALGVLGLTNFGALERLCVNGSPVGRRFAELGRSGEREASEEAASSSSPTDAPILPAQCERLARRAGLGLARTGSVATHGSGEIFLAFSTGCRFVAATVVVGQPRCTVGPRPQRLFEAAVDATEEAVLDRSVPGDDDDRPAWSCRRALPIDEMLG